MRESEIEKYLVARVEALGGEVRKVKWIGRRGAPDRLVMLPPIFSEKDDDNTDPDDFGWEEVPLPARAIWVELKATGKKPEPHQLREHLRMRKMGQHVEVIDSKELVDKLLEG